MTSEEKNRMQAHETVSQEEWLVARKALLAREKESTRLRDQLATERCALPWVKVEKEYAFDTPEGKRTLADLFDGRSQLVVYHFMSKAVVDFLPGWADFCPTCSMVADHINASFLHLAQRDVTLMAITRAPLARIEPFKARMDWHFPFVSSDGTDFNRDYGVLASQDEMTKGKVRYNYELQDWSEYPSEEKHGVSVFYKDDAGNVFRSYSSYGRGCEELLGVYTYLDLVPKGRDEDGLPFPMAWMRHHDRYDTHPATESGGSPAPSQSDGSCCSH
jgi:predicted dithiol-disulfide oxidoreductase (DUF899 family)